MMSFGVMGTTVQPQGQVQVVSRIVGHGQNPQEACDAPRVRWYQGLEVNCERGFSAQTLNELRRRGHQLTVTDDYDGQAVGYRPQMWLASWTLPSAARNPMSVRK